VPLVERRRVKRKINEKRRRGKEGEVK